jgi:hypothetical protein
MFAAETGALTAVRPSRRVVRWLAFCALLCPLVSGGVWLLGPYGWSFVVTASNAATVALSAVFEGVRESPGRAAEAISVFLAAALAALGPTLAMALSGGEEAGGEGSVVAPYPAWIAVMLAPVMLIYDYAPAVRDGRIPAYVSADFLVLFSAASAGVAQAYALWVRLRSESPEAAEPAAPGDV